MTTQSESEAERYHLSISWDDVQRDAGLLAQSLVGKGPWHGIVAVARGGLVPAALVARALNVRMLETVSAVAYHGEVLGSPELLKFPTAAGDGEGWLIIDDLVDTGTTMRIVRTILPKRMSPSCTPNRSAGRWPTVSFRSSRRKAGSTFHGRWTASISKLRKAAQLRPQLVTPKRKR